MELGRELGSEGFDMEKALLSRQIDRFVVLGRGLVGLALHASVLGLEEAQLVQEVVRAPFGEIPEPRKAVLDVLTEPRLLLLIRGLLPALRRREREPERNVGHRRKADGCRAESLGFPSPRERKPIRAG